MRNYILNVIKALFLIDQNKRGATPTPVKEVNPYDALIADMNQQVEFQTAETVLQFSMLPQGWITQCSIEQRHKLTKILVRAKWILELNVSAPDSACNAYVCSAYSIPDMVEQLTFLAQKQLQANKKSMNISPTTGGHLKSVNP